MFNKFIKQSPSYAVEGKPGSDTHKRTVAAYADQMHNHLLYGPYIYSSPTPAKKANALQMRDIIIREHGYRAIARPGGIHLEWVGTPDKRKPLDILNKDFRAGLKLRKQLSREGYEKEALLRLESIHFKEMRDTLAQANTSRRATETKKHYDYLVEKVNRKPKVYGHIYRTNPHKDRLDYTAHVPLDSTERRVMKEKLAHLGKKRKRK